MLLNCCISIIQFFSFFFFFSLLSSLFLFALPARAFGWLPVRSSPPRPAFAVQDVERLEDDLPFGRAVVVERALVAAPDRVHAEGADVFLVSQAGPVAAGAFRPNPRFQNEAFGAVRALDRFRLDVQDGRLRARFSVYLDLRLLFPPSPSFPFSFYFSLLLLVFPSFPLSSFFPYSSVRS